MPVKVVTSLKQPRGQCKSNPKTKEGGVAERGAATEKVPGAKGVGVVARGGKGEGGRGRNMPATLCICPGCVFKKYPGSRFCAEADHKKGYDNLLYQRKSRKDLSQEDRDSFDSMMKSDDFAGKTVKDFCKDNPPEMRRKSLVDFSQFTRSKGMRVSSTQQSGSTPMTERAFYRYSEGTLGLSPEESKELLGCAWT